MYHKKICARINSRKIVSITIFFIIYLRAYFLEIRIITAQGCSWILYVKYIHKNGLNLILKINK